MFRCFFFNDTATTEIYTLSLHDALPICAGADHLLSPRGGDPRHLGPLGVVEVHDRHPVRGQHPREQRHLGLERSEEHTSELQSRQYLVCRLLLEKKKKTKDSLTTHSVPN